MGELVLAYDVKSDNKTSKPRAFHALYIGPNDAGTGHSVFKLATKNMIITPKCKPIPIPMSDDVIQVINQMGEDDGSPGGIVFRNIHKILTVEDLYPNVDSQDNSGNVSDTSWDEKKHSDEQDDDKNILNHEDIEYDEVNGLNKDLLHLRNGFGENINNANN